MPNWCSNHIKIEGPKEKVEAIWSRATDDTAEGLLEAMHPIGEWEYNTALAEWGTKWDINMADANLELLNNGTIIEGYFESAWSPPLNAIQHYEIANPDVDIHLKYYEPANDFIGSNHYVGNETTLKLNSSNSLAFKTRSNREIDMTEFYNLMYQYENDCLRAALEYNKTFYADNDVKPEEELLFSITIMPFSKMSSTNLK